MNYILLVVSDVSNLLRWLKQPPKIPHTSPRIQPPIDHVYMTIYQLIKILDLGITGKTAATGFELYTVITRSFWLLQTPPPFWIFPRTILTFLLRLPYVQFSHPLSRYPCIYEKKFQKFSKIFALKKLGVGKFQQPPRPEREGVAAKINRFS